jgi:CspA family cold shock protein
MNTGTVKFFNIAKGFGFVSPDDGRADIFLPAAAVAAAGVTTVKPGQRIAFEQAPDAKGPKVVSLKLVGEAPAKIAGAERVTVYCDAGADATADIVEAVRAAGLSPVTQDYMAMPPGIDQMKRLSQMLSASGQSLVRRHDPLFFALQLDDRFITDQDFWTAIVEHPALINGPVLTASGRARICKSPAEVRAFLLKDEGTASAKPKTLSPRIAAMLRGGALPDVEPPPPVEPKMSLAGEPLPQEKARPAAKKMTKPKPAPKPKRKTAVKAAPAKAPAKKAGTKKATKQAKRTKK